MTFKDRATEDIFNGIRSSVARRCLPIHLFDRAQLQLDRLNLASTLEDLRLPPSNRLESLKGDRRGEFSVRINVQYRICFRWKEGEAQDVEIVDYH